MTRGFRTFSLLGFYITTFRHTRTYPHVERATTVSAGRIFGRGWALCPPLYHRLFRRAHHVHRALVVGRRTVQPDTIARTFVRTVEPVDGVTAVGLVRKPE